MIALLFIFVSFFVPSLNSAEREGRAFVRVSPETVAEKERLTLGDIAEIRSNDPVTVERLRAIALGYAPNVGAVRELMRERIVLAVAAAGFTEGAVQIEAPPVARVRRAAQVVEPDLVRAAVERAALTDLSAAGVTGRIVRLDLPSRIEVPSGSVEVRASISGVRDLFVPFIAPIELWVDGRIVRRLSATAQVEAFAPIIVAGRDLAANSRVREEDIKYEVRRLERAASLYLRNAEQLRGVAVRRTVSHGEALTTDMLFAEIIVHVGDPVRIIGESGTLSIAVTGEARASGHVGDRIQVKNLQSGTLLQAIVVDEGLVRVRF